MTDEPSTAPTWEIAGQFRSNQTGRLRGTVLRYWSPEAATRLRLLEPFAGDRELVALLSYDIAVGTLVSPTPTSDQIPVSAADPASVFLAAARYFEPGYTVKGKPGVEVAPIPEGAQA